MHRAAAIVRDRARETTSRVAWLSWLLGAALLVSVIAAALHLSEGRAFMRVAQAAEPWWLAIAVLLQAAHLRRARGNLAPWGTRGRMPVLATGRGRTESREAVCRPGTSISRNERQHSGREGAGATTFPPAAVKAAVLINIASYHLGVYRVALAGSRW